MNKIKPTLIIILILSLTNLFFFINWFNDRKYEEYCFASGMNNIESNIVYDVIISTKSDTIKLGEKYQAAVRLAYVNKKLLPSVLINDSVGKNDWNLNVVTDTLIFDDYFNSFVYENTPTEKGIYFWNGIIAHKYLGISDTLYFHVEYIVE
jgi:hypothetical protein